VPTEGNKSGPAELGQLRTQEWQRLQNLLEPFERAWHDRAGPDAVIDLAPFAPPPGDPLRRLAVLELIKADLEFRCRHGLPARVESYLEQFPDLGPAGELPPQLVWEEYRVRQRLGDRPPLTEYRARFPEQFPALLRLAEEDPLPTVDLPAPVAAAVPVCPGYQVLGELGRGGMGVVYRAWDDRHRKAVALKTLRGLDPAALYRLKQEFRALADLAHPNLVTLYQLHADEQSCFFTMELLQGVDFLTYVRAGRPAPGERTTAVLPVTACDPGPSVPSGNVPAAVVLSPEQVRRLREGLGQLAEGLLALHNGGKLHRDLKPSNVLVTSEGRVVLLDFGLAAEVDRTGLHQSAEDRILGTVPYMAPEQAACQAVSAASDWYAFGVLLYEALTGRLPFTGRALQILVRKQEEDPPPPGALVPGLPADLDALCVELLRREPADRPAGRETLRRLREGAGASPPELRRPPPAQAVPLVGRERHLRALAEAYDAARQGRPVAVYVHGRSGAGKSALVQRFLDGLADAGQAVVLAGRCYEQESVPYKALDGLVDALSRYLTRVSPSEAEALLPRDVHALARLFPVLRRVEAVARAPRRGVEVTDPQELRRRATAALRELLARLGDRRPLVLAIDDLQWGDADSAAVLAEVLRPPEPPALLLVAAYRSEEAAVSPCLRALLGPRETPPLDSRELAVEPLSPGEGRELALALLGAADPEALRRTEIQSVQQERRIGSPSYEAWAEAIARESGGNPFFVHELVQAVHTDPDRAGWAAAGGPGLTLPEVLGDRLRRLPEPSRRLLEVVAVAGRPLRQADACRAADWPDEDLTALAHLRTGRLLRGTGLARQSEIETYHDRIRETVLAGLDPETLRRHHAALARVLEASGQYDPEVLAIHWQGGGDPRRAGGYYEAAAAQAAEALAFDRAAKLYRLALELQSPAGVEERRLRVRLADALANAGRGAEAARQYLEAASAAGADEALDLRRRAALQFLTSGHVDDGLAALRTVLGEVGLRPPRTPRESLWSLLFRRLQLRLRGLHFRPRDAGQLAAEEVRRIEVCWTAGVGLSMVDTVQGAYFHTRGLLLALQAGGPDHLARALALEAAHVSIGGGRTRQRTDRLVEAAEALARQVGQPYVRALVTLARGLAADFVGDWPAGLALCDEAEAVFRNSCTGVVWERDTAQRFALWPLLFMGEVNELRRRVPLLLQEALERDDLYAVMNLSLVLRPFLRLAADEPGRARKEVREAMARWSQQGFHVQHMNRLHDEALIDLYEGNGRSAYERLTTHWPLLRRHHFLRVQQVYIFLLHLRARCALTAATAAADPRPLFRAAECDAGLLRREQMPWGNALADLVDGGVALGRGDQRRAVDCLRAAVGGCDIGSMRLYAAGARRRLGRLLGGDEGRALTAEADAWMAGQGIRDPGRMTALVFPGPRRE
jgi:serine/threonine protein kinase